MARRSKRSKKLRSKRRRFGIKHPSGNQTHESILKNIYLARPKPELINRVYTVCREDLRTPVSRDEIKDLTKEELVNFLIKYDQRFTAELNAREGEVKMEID